MQNFADLHLKPETLAKYGLPDIPYLIGNRFSTKTYATKDEAKLALFDDFWAATQDDERLWASD